MKAIQFNKFGIENLQLTTVAQPVPGPHEVLVKVSAAALNFLDIALISGMYNPDMMLPAIPVADGAGIVAATGHAVTKWKTGDRVTTHFVQQWQHGANQPATDQVRTGVDTPGLLSEYVVLPEYALVRTPANLTDIEAASLPIAGLTAWTGLIEYAGIRPGQVVLTQGTGGVSLFALQIALTAGARVIATTSSAAKAARLRQLGAHEVINYRENPEWPLEVKRLTGGEGVHATIDIAGSESIGNSVNAVRYNGFVGTVGFLTGTQLPLNLFSILSSYIRVQGYSVGSMAAFERFTAAIALNNIKPVIDTVFPLSETKAAFEYLKSGNHFGKIIIEIK